MKFQVFLYTLLFMVLKVNAQFTDSTTHFLKLNSGGTFNKTPSGINYLFNNGIQFNVKKKRTVFNTAASWIYGRSPEKLTNNDFSLTGNINQYGRSDKLYYWGLLNYTTSYSLNIKNQGQLGLGIACNFLNKENLWLNVSNGFVGELSRIVQGDTAVISYQTVRNSTRLQFMYRLGSRLSFRTSNYFQPSLRYISDHILSSDSEFIYQLWKGLQLNTRLLYNKVSRTEKENLIFTYGVSYQQYF